MSKVAICIAGEMRYWEITKNVFNSFDADIFISTWDTNDRQDNYPYKFHGNKNINNEIVDGLDNLIEAEFLPKEIESKFERDDLILVINGCNFGFSNKMVESIFTILKDRSFSFLITVDKIIALSIFLFLRSFSGKNKPISPTAAAPSRASSIECINISPSE